MKRSLDPAKLLYVSNRRAWRAWLKKHFRSAQEVWLVYYKQHTGKPRIPYNDAVEEALCFGWIDSTVKRLDEDRFAQRFSPRKPKSPYSQANKERLRALVKQGKVVKDVLATLGALGEMQFLSALRPQFSALRSTQFLLAFSFCVLYYFVNFGLFISDLADTEFHNWRLEN